MIGLRFALVTFFLLGAALAQVEEEVTVIPNGLGGESFPVKKRSVGAKTKDVVIELQMEPFDFDFKDVTPVRLRRELNGKRVMLQAEPIPRDITFRINKRSTN